MGRRKRQTKKHRLIIRKKVFVCIFLSLVIVIVGYFIFLTDYLKPQLNSLTASYISFNNGNSTDILKIDNLKKISDKKGKNLADLKALNFMIPKGKDLDYDIVLVPINCDINDKYIHYILKIDNDKKVKSLDMADRGINDERIIYHNNIKDSVKVSLYMWVSKEYKGKVQNISYEVKIKSR